MKKRNFREKEYRYINGNYVVFNNRAKNQLIKRALRIGEDLNPEFPDSIDLKINNVCFNNCPYCHESSNGFGKLADVKKTEEILSQLPKNTPIEIAIGGGDILANEKTISQAGELIDWIIDYGLLPRCTVNIKSMQTITDSGINLLNKIEGIGISIEKYFPPNRDIELPYSLTSMYNKYSIRSILPSNFNYFNIFANFVVHIIAGIFPSEDLQQLMNTIAEPILILGYKNWGRGKDYKMNEVELIKTSEIIKNVIEQKNTPITLGFDNLAIEQLGIEEILDKNDWEYLYMGNEFSHSMYIDAVNGEFAKTSRSEERVSWDKVGLLEYFTHDKINN